MSRKRKEKKARKRQSEAEETILRLHERGSYLELLTVARRRFGDPVRSEVGTLYADVADRVLAERLCAGDLDGLAEVMQVLGGTVRGRALAELADVVLAVRGGADAADLSKLEELSEGAGDGAPGAVAATAQRLLALATRRPGASRQDEGAQGLADVAPTGRDLVRLRRGLERLPWTAKGTMPPVDRGLEDPLARGLWLAARATAAIARRGYEPSMRQLNDLDEAFNLMRRQTVCVPYELGGAIEQRRELLAELLGTVRRLRRNQGGRLSSVLQRLRQLKLIDPLGTSVSAPSQHPILGHLDHAARKLWWEVVSLCGFTSYWARDELVRFSRQYPEALGPLIEIVGEVALGTGRTQRDELGRLIEDEDFFELACRMREASARESDPLRRALMWGVELKAWDRARAMSDFDAYFDDRAWSEISDVAGEALDRLVEMARELKRRFPEGQRRGIATVLREFLVMVAADLPLGDDGFVRASGLLLELLPDDAVLLTLRAAACFESEDVSEAWRVIAQLQTVTPVRAVDQCVLDVLVNAIATECNDTIDATFQAVRRVFPPEAWARACASTLPEWPKSTAMIALRGDTPVPQQVVRRLAIERLDLVEKYCGPSMPLEAARLAVTSSGQPSLQAAREYLERFDGVDATVLLVELLQPDDGGVVPHSGPLRAIEGELATAVIERLDLPVDEWFPKLHVMIPLAVRTRQLTALVQRLKALHRLAGQYSHDAVLLDNAVDLISEMALQLEGALPAMPRAESERREMPRRRNPLPLEFEQLALELWGEECEDDDDL